MIARTRRPHRIAAAVFFGALALAAGATVALGNPLAGGTSIATGQTLFSSVGCSACHTFKFARATGKIGPNLDPVKLTQAQIVTQITKGGCAVMTPAACAKYTFKMSPFSPRLTKAQIADVAVFVYTDRNKAPTGPPPATTSTTTHTTTGTTTTPGTTPTTTHSTTTTPGGGGGAPNECAPGVTIPTSGNSDGDDDEAGAPSDFDGCI
jgi:mono/diheme cytochrome c family protein